MNNLKTMPRGRRAMDAGADLSGFDPLTGLASRALFQQRFCEQWDHCCKSHVPVSLLLIGFDRFSEFRATRHKSQIHGALAAAGQVLGRSCERRADLVGRMRSGEFAALLADAAPSGARHVAERIQRGIAELQIPFGDSPRDGLLSVSIAVVSTQPAANHFPGTALVIGDAALRSAKQRGCGQIEMRAGLQ